MKRDWLLVCVLAVLLGACSAKTSNDDENNRICEQAIEIIEMCTGSAPPMPTEGCVDSYRANAEAIVAGGCDAIVVTDGKADSGGFWCWWSNRWMGLCGVQTLEEAAAVVGLATICPDSREDALCDSLRNQSWDEAQDAIASLLATRPVTQVISDTTVQYYLRERVISLLAWNVITNRGQVAEPEDYADRVDVVLTEHFPAYQAGAFPMALDWRPAVASMECTEPLAAALIFPGVVRTLDRDEFDEQMAYLNEAIPCLEIVRVETGSFVDPGVNATQASGAVDDIHSQYGYLPLHLVGYSQGAMNALRTLVDYPDIANRTKTVLTMNSAAHGSQIGDIFAKVVSCLDQVDNLCDSFPDFAKPTCEWALGLSPQPAQFMLEAISWALGIPEESLAQFIQDEDGIAAAPTLADFLLAHLPGVASLTTDEAKLFWNNAANDLPHYVLYTSFRSVISDRENLPASNALFFSLLERAGDIEPHNDMQVLLTHQKLGGQIADLEVKLPVAEGNHWQWELASGDIAEAAMPHEMTDRIPHVELLTAYFQTIEEVGLLFD